MGIFQFSN